MNQPRPILPPQQRAGDLPSGGAKPFWTRHLRREVQVILDLATLAAAFGVAYLLRFDLDVPLDYRQRALVQLPVTVLVQFTAVLLAGIYAFVWRYVGLSEIRAFLRAAAGATLTLLALRLGLPEALDLWRIPSSIILVDAVLAFGGLLGLRVVRRSLYERYERYERTERTERSERGPATERTRRQRVLLAGAGRAGVMAVREILGRGDLHLDLIGFVDDEAAKVGAVIQGVRVLGTTSEIPLLARRHQIDHVIITIAEADPPTLRRIVETCERARIKARIIPGLYEILDGSVSIARFRDVQVEDLLGRRTVQLDEDGLRGFLGGKSVLVTGAGGSIGAELSGQAARFNPLELLLVERSEAALFEVDRGLRHLWPHQRIEPLLADVGDTARMRAIFARYRPQVVLHAAAHKHVPLMESNAGEAIKNNVLATHWLAQLAGDSGVEAFVLISTDKAVQPSSVMGASKRLAELVVQAQDAKHRETRFVAVRFGNVLGSAGSVVPIFRQQIARGGPVTVTHPEAQRYFMTIPEAAQLVLQAGALGEGGEIMILDMGEPVRILDLARDMITLSGFRPHDELPIVFTGLRPGEKLVERLDLSGEEIRPTRHPKILTGRLQTTSPEAITEILSRLEELAPRGDDEAIRELLGDLLPEARLTPAKTPPASGIGLSSELLH